MKRITTVISGTGKYEICKNEHGYWSIDHAYIGADGRLAKPINGVEGLLRDTFEDAVNAAIYCGKYKEWRENNPAATLDQLYQFVEMALLKWL